jgi:hypothetical protein
MGILIGTQRRGSRSFSWFDSGVTATFISRPGIRIISRRRRWASTILAQFSIAFLEIGVHIDKPDMAVVVRRMRRLDLGLIVGYGRACGRSRASGDWLQVGRKSNVVMMLGTLSGAW